MIKAWGKRSSAWSFPLYAKGHIIRKFICKRCNQENEQKGQGTLRKICETCFNKLNPCEDGCGGFVKAAHNNSKFISGHNVNLISHEEQLLRVDKSRETMKKNGTLSCQHSKGERYLKPYLEPLGFIHSEDKSLRISNGFRTRYPDYYNPETKQIVEYFGTYWHRDRKLKNGQKHATPKQVIDWYFKQGWNCIIVWEGQEKDFIDNLTNLGGW
jgi:hypothetical protein